MDALTRSLSPVDKHCEVGRKRGEVCVYAGAKSFASLDFCGSCRSTRTLHVRVCSQAPRSLWSRRKSQTDDPNTKVRISNRVAVVRALRLTYVGPPAGGLSSVASIH